MGTAKESRDPEPGGKSSLCKRCYRSTPDKDLRKNEGKEMCPRCIKWCGIESVLENLTGVVEGRVKLTKKRREKLAEAAIILESMLPRDVFHYGYRDRYEFANTLTIVTKESFPAILNRIADRLSRSDEPELATWARAMIAWFVSSEEHPGRKDTEIRFVKLSLDGIAQTRDYRGGPWWRVEISGGIAGRPGELMIVPCPSCAAVDPEAETRPVLITNAGDWTGRWDDVPVVYPWPPQPPLAAQYWTAYLGQCKACSAILWGVTEPTLEDPKRPKKPPKSKEPTAT
jgi:hypothetical protein